MQDRFDECSLVDRQIMYTVLNKPCIQKPPRDIDSQEVFVSSDSNLILPYGLCISITALTSLSNLSFITALLPHFIHPEFLIRRIAPVHIGRPSEGFLNLPAIQIWIVFKHS